jgi:hypothetical protein
MNFIILLDDVGSKPPSTVKRERSECQLWVQKQTLPPHFRMSALSLKADIIEQVLLPGRLFMVGDPKQAIYRFRDTARFPHEVLGYLKPKTVHLPARQTCRTGLVPSITDFVFWHVDFGICHPFLRISGKFRTLRVDMKFLNA